MGFIRASALVEWMPIDDHDPALRAPYADGLAVIICIAGVEAEFFELFNVHGFWVCGLWFEARTYLYIAELS